MLEITTWNILLGILGAFIHALMIIVGIYVAINTRLTKLEIKMDILWTRVIKHLLDNKNPGGGGEE